MIRRPPRSTLFPYPTLCQSGTGRQSRPYRPRPSASIVFRPTQTAGAPRSEEHTSELQSHSFISHAVLFLNDPATTEIYTLPLPDALPIWYGPAISTVPSETFRVHCFSSHANRGGA